LRICVREPGDALLARWASHHLPLPVHHKDVGVDRLPLRLAEHRKRPERAGLVAVPSGEDQGPVGGPEGIGGGHALFWNPGAGAGGVPSRFHHERPANALIGGHLNPEQASPQDSRIALNASQGGRPVHRPVRFRVPRPARS
jgi:hypothetical protein